MTLFYMLPEIKYYKPKGIEEALKLINELEDAKIIAGGTDLLVDIKIGRIKTGNIIDISEINELRGIRFDDEHIIIGSTTTLQELIENERLSMEAPVIVEAAESMGSWQIRNIATIGGNLCNASPAADTAPPLMILNAKLKVKSIDGERIIPINKFFHAPRKTELKRNEILTEIIIPRGECEFGMKFLKLGRRSAHTLSIIAVAAATKTVDGKIVEARVSLNSVAPTPIRTYKTEERLVGASLYMEELEEKLKVLQEEISPISDLRASAEYRREMAIKLTREALIEASKYWRSRK